MKSRFSFKKLFQYFLQGLIILAPIAITAWAVAGLFNFIDNILPDINPQINWVDSKGNPIRIPGIGFILVILILILVGYISTSFIVGRLVALFNKVLQHTPGVNLIYTTLKDFFEAFAGKKRKFDKAVLVSIEGTDVWQVGFITQQDVQEFGLIGYVAVYVPQSYAFAGRLYFVKRERIRVLTHISSSEAMKFAISGGVTEIDEEVNPAASRAEDQIKNVPG